MTDLPEAEKWIPLRPTALADSTGAELLLNTVAGLAGLETVAEVTDFRRASVRDARTQDPTLLEHLRVAIGVICDLRTQGWTFRVRDGEIEARLPLHELLAAPERKSRVRDGHLVERDAQLTQRATTAFVRRMERRGRRSTGHWTSIFSLMRDGRELGTALDRAASLSAGDARDEALAACIRPYVQVVRRGDRCRFTGLALGDVWRYFRHTWTTAYQSTPGRHLAFLVRDAAAPNHPVVGIGALGSSIVQLGVRDQWIGWSPREFVARVSEEEGDAWALWLEGSLAALLAGVFVDDLVTEGVLAQEDLAHPGPEVIDRLRALSAEERRIHRLYPQRERHKRVGAGETVDWGMRAQTHLFRSKRAGALADLLEIRMDSAATGFVAPTGAALRAALTDRRAAHALRGVLRRIKAVHAGVDMMDITVCGAVAPYNAILGGKLVGLLMASPDVVSAYEETYRNAHSVIASAMAGRAVVRPPRLVLLGTTSLYGVTSSQYNRIRMPAEAVGGTAGNELRYHRLGRTAGFGSYHFSQETVEAMEWVLAQASRGREVNSIFGEGVNPKLRKVRAALTAVGLPATELLQHRQPRLVYAVPLAANFRDVLLGRDAMPEYLIPDAADASERIASFWRRRWLSARIEADEVRAEVARHSLAYPVSHGARVAVPRVEDEEEDLFEPTLRMRA
jgi:hypothetical protein